MSVYYPRPEDIVGGRIGKVCALSETYAQYAEQLGDMEQLYAMVDKGSHYVAVLIDGPEEYRDIVETADAAGLDYALYRMPHQF
jgi:hypothetical protein